MPVNAPADPYREALERLYGFERGNKGAFGLDGTRALLEDLGHPEQAFPSIHVAGTNGKGSTCAFLERVLRAAGSRTGLFTSPHLVDFRERIRVNGRMVAPEVVTRHLERITSVPAAIGRTFFEATFALAALAFAEAKVEVAVLETGLGGRLDSTNVVTPRLCVITPIALDHQDMLGDTIEAIAGEKAGIVKPGVPVLVGAQSPAALSILEARAREVGAPFHRVEDVARIATVHAVDKEGCDATLQVRGLGPVRARIGLLGRHQLANAALAAGAVALAEPALTADALREGLAEARWPGRLAASARLHFDGAHNPQGARVLREAWREALDDAPAALVLGMSTDKDAPALLEALEGPWTRVNAVAAASPRARTAGEIAALVGAAWPGVPVATAPTVAEGVDDALGDGGLVLACGSLFVVGEAMASVGADLEQL